MTEAEKEARKEAERRYPTLSPHPAEAMYAKSALHHYQQGSFIAGAAWQASRASQPTDDERDWLVGFFLGAGVAPHLAARFALDLLDSGFRRAPAESAAPPAYLALDLWQALNLPVSEFGAYFERNRWADTWANLLDRVRRLSGRKDCPVMVDGEGCELMNGHAGPHMGASDVGSSEPLPVGAPADPAVQGEPTDDQIHDAMEAQQEFMLPMSRGAMRAALRAALTTNRAARKRA